MVLVAIPAIIQFRKQHSPAPKKRVIHTIAGGAHATPFRIGAALAALFVCLSGALYGQTPSEPIPRCAPHGKFIEIFRTQLNLRVVSRYYTTRNSIIEILQADRGPELWTIIETTPWGRSCTILKGEGFEFIPVGDPV